MNIGKATYSPEDNKIRIYPNDRLEPDVYKRVRDAGFIWAPKQELFVAPMWTPDREDLATELCGEIGDEDTSLVKRAEERAERFDNYSERRAEDAENAGNAVASIAENITAGQPILVGHHSEKKARKEAEKIQKGLERAVKMWEQSKYWEERAAGAIHHAKYKELPSVRARRIKKLESDKRRHERTIAEYAHHLKLWNLVDTPEKLKKNGAPCTREQAAYYASNYAGFSAALRPDGLYWSAYDVLRPDGERPKDCPSLTIEEVQEKARKVFPKAGDHNRRWIAHYENRLLYERAMLKESGGTVTDQKKPEVGGAVRGGYSDRWLPVCKVNKTSVSVTDRRNLYNPKSGQREMRDVPCKIAFDKIRAVMTRAEVEAINAGEAAAPAPEAVQPPKAQSVNPNYENMKAALRAGVTAVSAPQLFPTPRELAERAAELLEVEPGHRVLEPSAGTGALLGALGGSMFMEPNGEPYVNRDQLHAVEINPGLAQRLGDLYPLTNVHCANFLECNGDLGKFDRILMNPPFENGSDIKHIQHALKFLKPGGRLVAICAGGSRQEKILRPLAEESGGTWERLPEGSFKESGTNVSAVLLSILS